ncbi:MAG: O-antigen ligase family protein [Candidatus Omnitrophota bacterium]
MLRIIDYQMEFLLILGWMLFFASKESLVYFLGSALLIGFFAIRNIYRLKNIALSTFSSLLLAVNAIFILLSFFSVCYLNSILLLSDFLLISGYFFLFFKDRRQETGLLHLLLYLVSVFSLVTVLRVVFSLAEPGKPLFISTIHEGIISGLGVLLAVYYLLNRKNWLYWVLLLFNIAGVFVSRSKAAFIGIVFFSLVLMVASFFSRPEGIKKRLLFPGILTGLLIAAVILVFIIPNPMKSSFLYSIQKDPYALNRIDIWAMSLRIFNDHAATGVGLNNFQEVCGQYNFKQTRGPANYFKLPSNTHNDYLQVMAETGVAGLLILLGLFYLLLRKLVSSSWFDINLMLLLFILFQAFFFNVLFNGFFIFLFLFLLKNLLEEQVTFKSFSRQFKASVVCLFVIIFTAGYLFPWLSGQWTARADRSTNPVRVYSLLNNAGYVNPLDHRIHYLKALSLYRYFKRNANLDAFSEAINRLKSSQRLNRYYIPAYLLEADLFLELLEKKVKYVGMEDEILPALETAEIYAPFNPFIKLTKAELYLAFNRPEQAKQEALNALRLEPEYVAALYFLQRHFQYFGNEATFSANIHAIRAKAKALNPEPGHYLYRLYDIPKK